MRIYKSNDAEKFNAIITSGVAGQIFYCSTETGEEDLGFELQRKVPAILEELKMTPGRMFEIIWDLQEDFDTMEYVYSTLINRYDLSKKECQDLIEFCHLNIPRNENNNAIHLKTWKSWRNRNQIWNEFTADVHDRQGKRIVDDAFLMKKIFTGGKCKIGYDIDYLMQVANSEEFARVSHIKFSEPVKNPDYTPNNSDK